MSNARRETLEKIAKDSPEWDMVANELQALWKVYDEYAAAIEELGGTLPPALDEYEGGQE